MQVTVRTIAPFTEKLGFREKIVVLTGRTVSDLLKQLSEELGGGFNQLIFDDEGKIRRYIKLLVNGRGLHVLQGLDTALSEGDVVAIFPPVAGGTAIHRIWTRN